MGKLLQFKNNLESIEVIKEVKSLRSVKPDKTVSRYIDLIKKGQFSKKDINALTKLVASARFTNADRSKSINDFIDLCFKNKGHEYVSGNFQLEVLHFYKQCTISKEQTIFGKEWLKNYFYNKKGELRNSKDVLDIAQIHSSKILKVSKSVNRFKFQGIAIVRNSHGYVNQVLPIYRAIGKGNIYFDYCPVHWGKPVILEGY